MNLERKKLWSALYDYKKLVGSGLFTRRSRLELVKKLEYKLHQNEDFSAELEEFSKSISRKDTGLLGRSRLYGCLAKEGFYSHCIGFHKKYHTQPKLQMAPTTRDVLQQLRDFTQALKQSTSFWYGSFLFAPFRTRFKEEAFQKIIDALDKSMASQKFFRQDIHANPIEIMECLIINVMNVRGYSGPTHSGLAFLKLLKQPAFANLKTFLPQSCLPLSYESLNRFAKKQDARCYRTLQYFNFT